MDRTVTKFAVYTRIFVILLQYLSNILIPDHEADAFVYPKANESSYSIMDRIIQHIFGGFVRWDAQYFMHIARYGYTFENSLAFFPLYPLLARLFAVPIHSICPWITLDSAIVLVFVILNFVLFVLSARTLFKLTASIFGEPVAYKSTVLFCVNPASIFFSAPYSECLFCYLTFLTINNCIALYKIYSNVKYTVRYRHILYILPICLSTVVRSNGILNIGFLVYTFICVCIKRCPRKHVTTAISFVTKAMFVIALLTVVCMLPFLVYQVYCYYTFCTNFDAKLPSNILLYAQKNNLVVPGRFSKYNQSWCHEKIPLAYSYVQNHYWRVGFLEYYEFKQLPNFLLAFPILFISLKMSFRHIAANKVYKNVIGIFSFDKLSDQRINVDGSPILNVFVIHILFLTLFCVFFVHIQVSTRMLCSVSPIFYWYCAGFFKDRKLCNFRDLEKMSLEQCGLIVYFLSYFVIGTVMFCNFLPWT